MHPSDRFTDSLSAINASSAQRSNLDVGRAAKFLELRCQLASGFRLGTAGPKETESPSVSIAWLVYLIALLSIACLVAR